MMIFSREAVYPGHDLVVATFILSRYGDDLSAAFDNALADNDISGAGARVSSALDLIRSIMEGVATPIQAIEAAKRRWAYEHANGGHAESLQAGEIQASGVEAEFLNLMQKAMSTQVVVGDL